MFEKNSFPWHLRLPCYSLIIFIQLSSSITVFSTHISVSHRRIDKIEHCTSIFLDLCNDGVLSVRVLLVACVASRYSPPGTQVQRLICHVYIIQAFLEVPCLVLTYRLSHSWHYGTACQSHRFTDGYVIPMLL